ncbi:MAG: hypothetical protein LBH22_08790 [Bacteroidales bacterium]|nr:hypothetical protein [Bacteroidales bacterium]
MRIFVKNVIIQVILFGVFSNYLLYLLQSIGLLRSVEYEKPTVTRHAIGMPPN